MASSFKNTIIDDTGFIKVPNGTANQRLNATVIQWTNTGSQSYSVITGTTPTLSNSSWTCPAGVTQIELLVVAGGGGGNGDIGGGGGAGGLIYNAAYPVTAGTAYSITVGAGGAASTSASALGANGGNSIFGTILAYGGGCGAQGVGAGGTGGSGGGKRCSAYNVGWGSAGQGNPGGGLETGTFAGGGGGAGAKGQDGTTGASGAGGIGRAFDITGSVTYYAGGGGGGGHVGVTGGAGGTGGGGAGGNGSGVAGTAGTASTGGGGGGAGTAVFTGGAGGSGVVIIRYYTSTPTASVRYNTTTSKLEYSDSTWKNAPAATIGSTLYSQVYNYTGHVQFFNVPIGVTSVTVKMWGAAGGGSNAESRQFAGGPGGFSQATIDVRQIPVLHVLVGQGGVQTSTSDTIGTWPGVMTNTNSGKCGRRTNYTAGYGGGRSEVMTPEGVPLVVAGGGGGAAGTGGSSDVSTSGGGGGGLIGANGWYSYNGGGGAGQGGTQSSGGMPSLGAYAGGPKAGGFRFGGYAAGFFDADSANYNSMGGGGDGYYGGGAGGAHCGGGGGSGYIHPNYCTNGFTVGTSQTGASPTTPPLLNDSYYNGSAGKSATNAAGNPGYVVILYYA
jgi:hypothetical protein